MPKVSIILPAYNQAHFLPAALDGVFSQVYPHYELIVVNDGSTDATADVLEHYRHRHVFTVITQENRGLPNALNTGFAHSSGEYLTWTSSDNIMLPDMLNTLVQALDRDRLVGLVYADLFLMDEKGRDLVRFNTPDYDPHLLLHSNLVLSCFLYRRECMEAIGGYNPRFTLCEDWEYWIRISQYYSMKHVPQALYRHRLHQTSLTSGVVRRTAPGMSYAKFAARIRQRLPMRWYVGKLKWWWLRLFYRNHPVVVGRTVWQRIAGQAASLD